MNPSNLSSSQPQNQPTNRNTCVQYSCYVFSFLVLPLSLALILYNTDPSGLKPGLIDGSILRSLEKVGSGRVTGPEDLVYDPVSKALYTGCGDGSIKRIMMGGGSGFEDGDVEVEELVNTGGRPLGLALSRSAAGSELIIADAFKSAPGFLYDAMSYPWVQKVMIVVEKCIGSQRLMSSAGVLVVDLEGKPIAHLYDLRLASITSGIKIGQQLYMGSLFYEHIFRLNLTQYEF